MSRLPAAERRMQLLDCAADLFAQRGYARATTAELAKAAGVTEPIIYRHFKSKRDLFVELIRRTGEQTLERWRAHLADADDPAERLKRLIGDNPMVTGTGKQGYRVFLQAISEVGHEEAIRVALEDHLRKLHDFLQDELQRAQDNRRVTTRFSADLIAWLLIYTGLGYGVSSAMQIQGHGFDASTGTHVQEVIARILVGRGGDSPPGSSRPPSMP